MQIWVPIVANLGSAASVPDGDAINYSGLPDVRIAFQGEIRRGAMVRNAFRQFRQDV